MYDGTIYTGDPDEIGDSLESFPSGHSTTEFAGFVFLYLYEVLKRKAQGLVQLPPCDVEADL